MWIAWTTAIKENVLQQVQEIRSKITRSPSHAVRVVCPIVWYILQEHDMHPFHVQRVQALQLDDYAPGSAFSQRNFGKCATDSLFSC